VTRVTIGTIGAVSTCVGTLNDTLVNDVFLNEHYLNITFVLS